MGKVKYWKYPNKTTQIIIVLTEANIWVSQASVIFVSQYNGVFCIQTNILTEIMMGRFFFFKWLEGIKE